MHGVGIDLTHPGDEAPQASATAAYVSTMAPVFFGNEQTSAAAGSMSSLGAGSFPSRDSTKPSKPVVDPLTLDLQMGLPLLDSKPGAAKTLYLDFNGDFQRDWWFVNDYGQEVHYSNVTTPLFDTDGNRNSFGTAEQNLIQEIWARVAEDFVPFNINVTTAYYGAFENGKALQVVIGGDYTNWLNIAASGIAPSIGAFTDSAPNTVFVFDLVAWEKEGLWDSDNKVINGVAAIATTASHEAGHAFGLRHQAYYYVNGAKLSNYNRGTDDWTPIMGANLSSDRTTWHYGPSDLGANTFQSDLDLLRDKLSYVTDDHGNLTSYASPLLAGSKSNSFAGNGVIHHMGDVDFFKFTTSTGQVYINVNAAQYGPNLIPVAELWSSSGLIMQATSGSATQSTIDAFLKAGTYYVRVRPGAGYGNLGQYSVFVSLEPTMMKLSSALASDTTTTTTTTSGGTYQDPLLAQSTSTTLTTSSSSMGAGQSTTPMYAPLASPSAVAKQKLASRTGLHDDLFAQESFVDELGDIAALHSSRREES